MRHARALGLENQIELGWQACFGRCRQGPNVLVRVAQAAPARTLLATTPSGPGQNAALYNGVHEEHVAKILQSHVARGIILRELVLRPDAITTPPTLQVAGEREPVPTPVPTNTTSNKESGGDTK